MGFGNSVALTPGRPIFGTDDAILGRLSDAIESALDRKLTQDQKNLIDATLKTTELVLAAKSVGRLSRTKVTHNSGELAKNANDKANDIETLQNSLAQVELSNLPSDILNGLKGIARAILDTIPTMGDVFLETFLAFLRALLTPDPSEVESARNSETTKHQQISAPKVNDSDTTQSEGDQRNEANKPGADAENRSDNADFYDPSPNHGDTNSDDSGGFTRSDLM